MARKLRFPPTLRERLEAANKGDRFYAAMAGVAPKMQTPIPPKRERAAPTPSLEPSEAEIQRAILDYLRQHPKVAIVGRFNRGVMQSSYNGHESYVRFNTIRGFPDIHGLLKGGRALYVEVKRKGGRLSDDQRDFLEQASKAGALAFMATSIEDVARALV